MPTGVSAHRPRSLRPRYLVSGVILVLVLGMVAPRFLIGSGVEQFEDGEKRAMAEFFLAWHGGVELNERGEALFITQTRVTYIEKCPGAGGFDDIGNPPAFSGRMTLHTIFGIPYRTIEVSCGPNAG